MPLAESESDSWQGYALKRNSRQPIALAPSSPEISVLRKRRTSVGRDGNVILPTEMVKVTFGLEG
jgi:hypothetical protein